MLFQFHFTSFQRRIAEIKINPTKNDRIKIGWVSIVLVMMLAKNRKLTPIHKIRHNKKVQSIFFRNAFRLPVKKFLRLGIMLFIAWISLSYIHVITAMVPQLTQGITSQAHIRIPFKNIMMWFRILVILDYSL